MIKSYEIQENLVKPNKNRKEQVKPNGILWKTNIT